MKIAVYGDSFTVEFDATRRFAWFNLLAQKMGGVVENEFMLDSSFGIGGASTFYSYKKFLESYKRYDFVIFVAGDPYRYTKPIYYNNGTRFISNVSTAIYYMKNPNITSYFKSQLEKLLTWFEVSDADFQEAAQNLILSDVANKTGGKCLILPANDMSFNEEKRLHYNTGDFTLTDFCKVMHKSLRVPEGKMQNEKIDKICCHFTEEGNNLLANMLYESLTNQTVLKLPESIQHNNTWDYYYE